MKKNYFNLCLIVIFGLIQLVCLITISPRGALESSSLSTISKEGGDYVYYLQGALSLYQLNPYEKFNDKLQPIAGSKPVGKTTFNQSQATLALLYPFPSFKFGYSLSIAALTLPLDNQFFQNYLPRLSFSNFIFGIMAFIFILLTLSRCGQNNYVLLLFTALYASDIFSINNNYQYQSHTISGIMYVSIAYYLFLKDKNPGNLKFFLWYFLISLSIFSSSHIFPLALSFGGLVAAHLLLQKNSIADKFLKLLFGLAGFCILPGYILLVESYLNFELNGMPTYFYQMKWYSFVVNQLVSTYPLFERSIWDFRIWNHYIIYILAPLFLLPFLYRQSTFYNFKSGSLDDILKKLSITKAWVLLVPLIAQLLVTSFYSQPIVRALVPNLIIYSIFIAILYGYLFEKINLRFLKILITGFIITALSLNLFFYIKLQSADPRYRGEIFSGAPQVVIPLSSQEIIWERIKEYFDSVGAKEMPVGQLDIYSFTLKELFQRLQTKNNINLESIPDNLWLQIRPLDIVESYSHTRRFIPEFNSNKRNIVTTKAIQKDFNLYFELFKLIDSGYLSDKSIKIIPIKFWEPRFFDQEYNYIYGYNQRIKKYLAHTDMENVDMRSVYYINLKALYEIYSKVDLEK